MPPLEIGVKSQSEPAAVSYSEYLLRIADVQFDATRRSPFDPKELDELVISSPETGLSCRTAADPHPTVVVEHLSDCLSPYRTLAVS